MAIGWTADNYMSIFTMADVLTGVLVVLFIIGIKWFPPGRALKDAMEDWIEKNKK